MRPTLFVYRFRYENLSVFRLVQSFSRLKLISRVFRPNLDLSGWKIVLLKTTSLGKVGLRQLHGSFLGPWSNHRRRLLICPDSVHEEPHVFVDSVWCREKLLCWRLLVAHRYCASPDQVHGSSFVQLIP